MEREEGQLGKERVGGRKKIKNSLQLCTRVAIVLLLLLTIV
jgi:hypothetical protein